MCPSDNPPSQPPKPARSPSEEPSPQEAAAEARRLLLSCAEELLPPDVYHRLRQLARVVPGELIAVLTDPTLRPAGSPGNGWAPVHAAQILAEVAPQQAVEPLLDTLATVSPLTDLFMAVAEALEPLGKRLIEPILLRLPTAVGEYRIELWRFLGRCGARDPRVLDQLLLALNERPDEGALALSEYGDPAALPYLGEALDRYKLGPADRLPHDDFTVFELREAILELGGKLTAAQQAKYERALWTLRVERGERDRPVLDRRKLDAPCPCGSGRPYRNCCLQ
jgi:hypothetical protein